MPHVKAAEAAISLGHRVAPALLWMGMHVGKAVVSQTTKHDSAGYGMHVMPLHSDWSTGGWRSANSTRCGCAAAAD